MNREKFNKAKSIIERIEHCESLIQQLRKASQMLSRTSNEGLSEFLAAFNEMNNGEYLINEIVDEIISRYQKKINEFEEQLDYL